ncbi:glycosyltransferase [Brevibacillus fortis]|uniref:glycosyltransferase n=1 Tax=Brevibacillus fortis TaxID=2126352 RepID=UPI002E2065C3|nr:glycosyltransferase [Brevibacillus fortis]
MKVSACVITKNEEQNLPVCLESVKEIASEIVVVDTGSTDSTIAVAKKYQASVYHFDWIDDFSAARNFALSKTSGDWIIFLDADEFLSEDSKKRIVSILNRAEEQKNDFILGMIVNIDKSVQKTINVSTHIRIFRSDPSIRYIGAIHERVMKNGSSMKILDAKDQISIIHIGYSQEIVQSKNKSERNLKLLFKEWDNHPNRSDLAFYISESYMINQKFEEALTYAQKAVQLQNATLVGLYEKNYVNLINCMLKLEYPQSKITETIHAAISSHPEYPDFYFFLGDMYRASNRIRDAIEAFNEGIERSTKLSMAQSSAYFNVTKVLTIIGQLYLSLNELPQSVESFVNATQLDKSNYRSLIEMLKVFSLHESLENTLSVIASLYDVRDPRDILLLLNASVEVGNKGLASHFYGLLNDPTTIAQSRVYAQHQMLQGKYVQAAALFQKRFLQSKHIEDRVNMVAAAMLSADVKCLDSVSHLMTPSLLALINRAEQGIDPEEFSYFIHALIRLNCWEQLLEYAELIDQYQQLLHTAECFYENQAYNFAIEFYQFYLEKESDALTQSTASTILIKMAKCLYLLGDWEQAIFLLKEAQMLNPNEYAVYEWQLTILMRVSDLTSAAQVSQAAMQYFPDSPYLKSIITH